MMAMMNDVISSLELVRKQRVDGNTSVPADNDPQFAPREVPCVFDRLPSKWYDKMVLSLGTGYIVSRETTADLKNYPFKGLGTTPVIPHGPSDPPRGAAMLRIVEGNDAAFKRCKTLTKASGVTISQYFFSACSWVLAHICDTRGLKPEPIQIDVNMRTRVTPAFTDDDVMNGISALSFNKDTLPKDNDNILSLCQRVKTSLEKELKGDSIRLMLLIGDHTHVADHTLEAISKAGGAVGGVAFTFSNCSSIGIYNYPTDMATTKIHSVCLCNGAQYGGAGIVAFMTTTNGHFCYTFMAESGAIEPAVLEEFQKGVLEFMEGVTDDDVAVAQAAAGSADGKTKPKPITKNTGLFIKYGDSVKVNNKKK